MRNRALLTEDNRTKLESDGLPSAIASHIKNRLTEKLEKDIELLGQNRPDLLKLALETVIRTSTRVAPDVLEDVLSESGWKEQSDLSKRVAALEDEMEELQSRVDD